MVIEQSRLLELDWDQAIATLPELLTTADTRRQALKIAEQIAYADGHLDTKEQVVIARIAAALHFTSLSSCPG
ncbi:MAG: TerB family tellurite resistance protein [Myxococcota bacterium]|nr:TerB family tellurite resistance protein [Myxococcota bacterium]